MKKLMVLSAFASLLVCGCKDNGTLPEVIPDGGFSYSDIYVLENESLIDAQDYKIGFPASGGEVELRIVHPGDELQIPSEGLGGWLAAASIGIPVKYKSPDHAVTGYVQDVRFSALENKSGKRDAVLLVIAPVGNGFAANFHVVQAGR